MSTTMVSENSQNIEVNLVLVPIDEVQTVRWNAKKAAVLKEKKENSGLSFKKIEILTEQLGNRCSDAFIIRLVNDDFDGVSVKQLEALCKAIGAEMKDFIPQIELKISQVSIDDTNNS
jgi:Zn finger protein HypA/HybF involved in hydrogenase expression